MKIAFVTSNPGKVAEAQARLRPLGHEVVGVARELQEIQADSLGAVARHKAETLRDDLAPPYFCEDAGLFVDSLQGFPGVYSSHAFRTLGCQGILRLLEGSPRRAAHFEAVIAYRDPARRVHLLAGRSDGEITTEPRGEGGFGFDPIFRPRGSPRTFAELAPAEKGALSHRGRALDALAQLLAREPKV